MTESEKKELMQARHHLKQCYEKYQHQKEQLQQQKKQRQQELLQSETTAMMTKYQMVYVKMEFYFYRLENAFDLNKKKVLRSKFLKWQKKALQQTAQISAAKEQVQQQVRICLTSIAQIFQRKINRTKKNVIFSWKQKILLAKRESELLKRLESLQTTFQQKITDIKKDQSEKLNKKETDFQSKLEKLKKESKVFIALEQENYQLREKLSATEKNVSTFIKEMGSLLHKKMKAQGQYQ